MPAHSGHGLIFAKFEHLDSDEKVICCKTLLIRVLLNNSNKKKKHNYVLLNIQNYQLWSSSEFYFGASGTEHNVAVVV